MESTSSSPANQLALQAITMGSPEPPVITNLVMDWLEQQAILTSTVTRKPKLWKGYFYDMMEVVRKGCEQELTYHSVVDTIYSIHFIYEEESDKSLPLLETLVVQKKR